METAIKKAIEEGYVSVKDNTQAEYDYKVKIFTENWEKVVLQPLFWQALGKALGGVKTHAWKTIWHRFIDALSEGQTAEDFFSKLLI